MKWLLLAGAVAALALALVAWRSCTGVDTSATSAWPGCRHDDGPSEPATLDTIEAFFVAMHDTQPGWRTEDRGLLGPGGTAVFIRTNRVDGRPVHHALRFVIDERASPPIELFDCVAGDGATPILQDAMAARLWAGTTAPAWLELTSALRGEHGTHLRGDDPEGVAGWHVIAGSIMAYVAGASGQALQDWYVANSPLPALSNALSSNLPRDGRPHSIKILLGGTDIAEVSIDAEPNAEASAALRGLPWPRLQPGAVLRTYVVAMHPEDGAPR